ncbi:MAG TPA: ferric reductase-like transmembrane domain-containing protein, partial [Candidatus Limnocylindrales bacterium]
APDFLVRGPDLRAVRFPKAIVLAVYALAVAGPFILIMLARPASGRPFIAEFGSALGISALGLLALQLVLPARLAILSSLGADVAVRLHRRLADVVIAAVAAHVAAVMVADPGRLGLLGFFGAPWRAQAAIGSVAALATLGATSFIRRRLRLSYAVWRGIHLGLGAMALLLGIVHTIGVGRYLANGPQLGALLALGVGGLGATIVMRGPWLRRGTVRPYRIERVVPERGGAVTLELVADGHWGQRFAAGQFAWLRLPGLLSTLSEHPFSYSSSALVPDRPSFTIKKFAGFTARAAELEAGTRLLVDGPHGAFRLKRQTRGVVLVAGGIGITPSMSVLRTAAQARDRRHYILIYSSKSLDSITFRDELETLEAGLDLEIVHVLSSPPPEWPGERGRINAAVLDRHLPADLSRWQFLVCGSGPFVDAAVGSIVDVGVPGERVHAERFVEV